MPKVRIKLRDDEEHGFQCCLCSRVIKNSEPFLIEQFKHDIQKVSIICKDCETNQND